MRLFFRFTDANEDIFIVEILDENRIAQARDLIDMEQQPSFFGEVVIGRQAYNPQWNFHVDPSNVHFFAFGLPTCDFPTRVVEENLKDVGNDTFLPSNIWCPMTSRLVDEVVIAPSAPMSPDVPIELACINILTDSCMCVTGPCSCMFETNTCFCSRPQGKFLACTVKETRQTASSGGFICDC
mmetsp:Transcript_3495/g.3851  ORF Transcript_3495/g.3851 Transcript_3495/m.3851 type:complete len:183 (+) Transcript_3495:108-656(+)